MRQHFHSACSAHICIATRRLNVPIIIFGNLDTLIAPTNWSASVIIHHIFGRSHARLLFCIISLLHLGTLRVRGSTDRIKCFGVTPRATCLFISSFLVDKNCDAIDGGVVGQEMRCPLMNRYMNHPIDRINGFYVKFNVPDMRIVGIAMRRHTH